MPGKLQQIIGKKNYVGTKILTFSKNTTEESTNISTNQHTIFHYFLLKCCLATIIFELILVTNLIPVAPQNLPLHIFIDVKVIPLWAKITFQLWWGLNKPYAPVVGL